MAESSPEGGGETRAGVEAYDPDDLTERDVEKLNAEDATVFTQAEGGSFEKSDFEMGDWKQTLEDHEENADVVGDVVDRYTDRDRDEQMFRQMKDLNSTDMQVQLVVSEEVAEDIEADGEEYEDVEAAEEAFLPGPTEEEAAEQTAEEFEFVGEEEKETQGQEEPDVEYDLEQEPATVAYETGSVEAGYEAASIREDELSKEEQREVVAAATLAQSSSDTVIMPGSPEEEDEVVEARETDDGFETEHKQDKEASNALPGNASLETSGNNQLKPGPVVKGIGAGVAGIKGAAEKLGLSQGAAVERGQATNTGELDGTAEMSEELKQKKEEAEKMVAQADYGQSRTTGGQNV